MTGVPPGRTALKQKDLNKKQTGRDIYKDRSAQ